MANVKNEEVLQQEKLVETVSKTEKFFQENKKTIWGALIAVVVIGLGILAYTKFVHQPAVAEAQEQLFPAESAFANGEFETALNGDGNFYGFVQIIDEYGKKAGAAVYLYAGICEMQLGNYQEAISYFKNYSGKDSILKARATSCVGDCYSGLEDHNSAVKYYLEAAKIADDMYAAGYLLKAGITYEILNDDANALECYKTIKNKYPQSVEGYDIDKYISRIENK